MGDPAETQILRAKYLDWCSAKVADQFLALTPEQIYDLAHRGARSEIVGGVRAEVQDPTAVDTRTASERGASSADSASYGPAAAAAVEEPGLVYRALVERVTEVLAARLRLPTFEEWCAAYRADPGRHEQELLGLWRRGV